MDLKAGDKVLISAQYSKSIGVVEKITPAGNIRLKNGELYSPDGNLKTKDIWNVPYIRPLTPEMEEEIQKDSVKAKALRIMHKTTSLTYEQAVEVLKILKGGQNG